MEKKERYYYTFYYIDGTTEVFEKESNDLSNAVMNLKEDRIEVDNTFIILSNVIRITVETESERKAKEKEMIDNLTGINY